MDDTTSRLSLSRGSAGPVDRDVQKLIEDEGPLLSNGAILDILKNCSDTYIQLCIKALFGDSFKNADAETVSSIKLKLKNLYKLYEYRYSTCGKRKTTFESKYCNWLNEPFDYGKELKEIKKTQPMEGQKRGRPELEFEDKSARSQRRDVQTLSKSLEIVPKKKLLLATSKVLSNIGQSEASSIVKELTVSPARPIKMIAALKRGQKQTITEGTVEESLSLLLDAGLTKRQYKKIRAFAEKHQANQLFPSYQRLQDAKLQCRPPADKLVVTETCAAIPLEDLLQHTTERIVALQEEVIEQDLSTRKLKFETAKLICTWGFDGSSGQANYKQKFADASYGVNQDSNLFATTLIPLQLVSSNNVVYWKNRLPQSVRFCRPLKLQYAKETTDLILKEKEEVDSQIADLISKRIEFDINGKKLQIGYSCHMTIIDGKVFNAVTGNKSSQSCGICHAKAKEFNNLDNMENSKFAPEYEALQFGISPLHLWIRFFEFCIHLAYKLEIRKWKTSSTDEKLLVQSRKHSIQKSLWEKMGLRVDYPNSNGSGNSNDGNTARRAFADYEQFADILGLDRCFVKGLRNVLYTISSQMPIDPEKIGSYCALLATSYVQNYSWYYMPSTVHKVLIHGADIVRFSVLPLGVMGEEAAESRNKDYKYFRKGHARKSSRILNLMDVFNRCMDTSDPIISTFSLNERAQIRNRKILPTEVVSLLLVPELPDVGNIGARRSLCDDSSEEI